MIKSAPFNQNWTFWTSFMIKTFMRETLSGTTKNKQK